MTDARPDEPVSPAPRYLFGAQQRLRKAAEFDRVYAGKIRAADDRLLIFALRNELGHSRVGLSVSRKHGGSVRRQRIKRLLREAYRLAQHELPRGLDLILIPRPGSGGTMESYQESLRRLVRKLDRKLPANPGTDR